MFLNSFQQKVGENLSMRLIRISMQFGLKVHQKLLKFQILTDLSQAWSSIYAVPILIIGLLIIADIFVSVAYMGERYRKRRRFYNTRPYRRHHNHYRHGRPPYGIGRMGYSEDKENPDEYQRSANHH